VHDCGCGSDAGIGCEMTDEGGKILVRDDDAGSGGGCAVCGMKKSGSPPLKTRELPRMNHSDREIIKSLLFLITSHIFTKTL